MKLTLTALIGEREIACKEITANPSPSFQTRVEMNKFMVEKEIKAVRKALNGNAYKVRFMITAQSKMNDQ